MEEIVMRELSVEVVLVVLMMEVEQFQSLTQLERQHLIIFLQGGLHLVHKLVIM